MNEPITPLDPAQVAIEEKQAASEGIVLHDLVALDMFASEITGGPQDETISTRLAIDSIDGHGISKVVGKVGSELLDVFQHDHGADAAAGDMERAKTETGIILKSGIA